MHVTPLAPHPGVPQVPPALQSFAQQSLALVHASPLGWQVPPEELLVLLEVLAPEELLVVLVEVLAPEELLVLPEVVVPEELLALVEPVVPLPASLVLAAPLPPALLAPVDAPLPEGVPPAPLDDGPNRLLSTPPHPWAAVATPRSTLQQAAARVIRRVW